MQNVSLQLVPGDIRLTEGGIGSPALVEGTLLGGVVSQHQRVGGSTLCLHILQVDVFIFPELFHDVCALGIVTHTAQRHQRHSGVQLRQINDIIAQAAAGRAAQITGNRNQLTGLGEIADGVEHIDDHITGDSDAFFTHGETSFLW